MAKHYAWSTFNTKVNEWGRVIESISPGDEVDAKKLGVSQEDFDEYVENGVVREAPYPDIATDVAPTEYYREQSAAEPEMLTAGEREELEKYRTAEAAKAEKASASDK